uniref:Uncharacterized protein n=1 Tax=Anguilla anguilla TaxID=7936 RepID=A0A0E9XSE6_ANGAN
MKDKKNTRTDSRRQLPYLNIYCGLMWVNQCGTVCTTNLFSQGNCLKQKSLYMPNLQ